MKVPWLLSVRCEARVEESKHKGFRVQLRAISIFLFFALMACNPKEHNGETVKSGTSITGDTTTGNKPPINDTIITSTIYANERFKEVIVKRTGDHEFLIAGKAQIFEANFGWVIEDGHNELQNGHHMTDAGAPAWGNFSFTIDAPKENPNSTLHLILFESSPKDGSRQYELPILLY